MFQNRQKLTALFNLPLLLVACSFEVTAQAMTLPEVKPLKPAASMPMWFYNVSRNFRYPIPTNFDFAYIDKTGKTVIAAPFVLANDFSHGVAIVRMGSYSLVDGKLQMANLEPHSAPYALLDANTGKISPCPGRIYGNFYDKLALVEYEPPVRSSSQKFRLIDSTGKFDSESFYDKVKDYSEGLMGAQGDSSESLWGYKDSSGKFVIEPKFAAVERFSEGLAAVSLKTNYFGAKRDTPEFYHSDRYAYIDKTGAIKIAGPYLEARPFKNGVAAVMLDGKWGYIDKTGKQIINCQYDWVGDFTGELAPVEKDMLVGYIDKSGKTVIPFKFKDGREFADGLAPVTLDARRWGYIDITGSFKIEPTFQRAFPFNSGRALVYVDAQQARKPTANDVDTLMQSAMVARNQVQFNQARSICSELIALAPGTATAKRAELFLKTSLPDHDIAQNVHQYYTTGMMHAQMAKFDQAESQYNLALAQDPKFYFAYGALAYIYLEQKQFDKAEAALNKALKLNPDYARGLWRLSRVYKATGKTDLAKTTLAKAKALDPDDDFITDD